jgi:hypothetical protein
MNGPQILGTDLSGVLWTPGNVGEHQLDEGVAFLCRKRPVNPPLEPDR